MRKELTVTSRIHSYTSLASWSDTQPHIQQGCHRTWLTAFWLISFQLYDWMHIYKEISACLHTLELKIAFSPANIVLLSHWANQIKNSFRWPRALTLSHTTGLQSDCTSPATRTRLAALLGRLASAPARVYRQGNPLGTHAVHGRTFILDTKTTQTLVLCAQVHIPQPGISEGKRFCLFYNSKVKTKKATDLRYCQKPVVLRMRSLSPSAGWERKPQLCPPSNTSI